MDFLLAQMNDSDLFGNSAHLGSLSKMTVWYSHPKGMRFLKSLVSLGNPYF